MSTELRQAQLPIGVVGLAFALRIVRSSAKTWFIFLGYLANLEALKKMINYLKKIVHVSLVSAVLWGVPYFGSTANAAATQPRESIPLKQRQSITSQLEKLSGVWHGSYICGQGITRLQLIIEATSTTEITAQFMFSAHDENPGVPSGWFSMEGTYQVAGLNNFSNRLELNASNWIDRPSGYSTVDLLGTLYFEENRLVGNVTNNRCSTFDVERIGSLDILND